MTHPISKEQAVQLAREAGVVDGPKILMMATPDELHRLAQAAFKLGRNSAVDEAKRAIQESSSPFTAAEVIADLLMYAGDNGYSHIDYADTMRHAAALLSAPALPVPSDSDDLIKALADVRDLFPIPERGSKLEHAWMEAVAFPESVPAYVRACIAPAALPVGELTDEQILDKKRIEQCVAVFVNVATFGSHSKYEDGAPTPNRLLQLDCAKYLHGLVSTEDFESANKFLLDHFEAVPASPSTAGERDNKTEMLAKLTAWLDSLGGKLHTYSLRGIALAGFEEGWSAALMQSTADHIAQNRKLVAALPVGELTPDAISELIVEHKLMDQAWPTQKMLTAFALAAASSQPAREPLPLMSEAFRTTVAHGPSEDYRMVFKFKDLDSLHAADDEWRKFRGAP